MASIFLRTLMSVKHNGVTEKAQGGFIALIDVCVPPSGRDQERRRGRRARERVSHGQTERDREGEWERVGQRVVSMQTFCFVAIIHACATRYMR